MTNCTSSRLALAGLIVLFAIMPTIEPRAQGASGGRTACTAGVATGGFDADLDFAQVREVVATMTGSGDGETTWRFQVTVEHNDEGWDHYADLWQVVNPDTGDVYGERELLHPHDNEQPFTRSLSGITIPSDQTHVLVRARCNVHGFGGREVLVDLTAESGELFEVRR